MDGMSGFVAMMLVIAAFFYFYIWLPGSMASSRGRSSFGWVILTIVFSPFITVIALLVLGPTFEVALKKMERK